MLGLGSDSAMTGIWDWIAMHLSSSPKSLCERRNECFLVLFLDLSSLALGLRLLIAVL